MKTAQKVTAWEVVKASREITSELGLEESSSSGRREEENTRQRKQHAHVRQTHWHEITR